MANSLSHDRTAELIAKARALAAEAQAALDSRSPRKRHWRRLVAIGLGVALIVVCATLWARHANQVTGAVTSPRVDGVLDPVPTVSVASLTPIFPPTTPLSRSTPDTTAAVDAAVTTAVDAAAVDAAVATAVDAAAVDAAVATAVDPAAVDAAVTTAVDPAAVDAAVATAVDPAAVDPAAVDPAAVDAAVTTATAAPALASASGIAPFSFEIEADGKAHMRGLLPSQEVADEIEAGGKAVLGDGGVVTEYEVRPGVEQMFDADAWHSHVRQTLFFPTGIAGLQPTHDSDLDVIVLLLATRSDLDVHIQAYTDDLGSDDENVTLSGARARRVAEYLTGHGIAPERITKTVGAGETSPIGDNSTDEGRALNRRVAIHVTVRP